MQSILLKVKSIKIAENLNNNDICWQAESMIDLANFQTNINRKYRNVKLHLKHMDIVSVQM